MIRLYPESKLLAADMGHRENMLSYDADTELRMINFAEDRLQHYINADQYFPCVSVA